MAKRGPDKKTGQASQRSRSEPPTPTIKDMGLTYDQSSNFQQLADIPEPEFEDALNIPGML